ncbi:unnamed protein product [Cuscuta campestris]|uniref:Uncharacterized protein n=2 Tax=Cuscuta sect. Cleistogrammica TaxID=1824901 RepID=A0A484MC37_9ASTE|nr:hypothetical protein DM860_008972 [Cuscuta australis]VFQ86147.1 unnamed protein product [Cuscuta campestris]
MGRVGVTWGLALPPGVSPAAAAAGGADKEDQWRSFYSSVNAVSFGFVATAILIAMFLVMAIFERLLRPAPSSDDDPSPSGASHRVIVRTKLDCPSPEMTVYGRGVSVLMPGEDVPTFIAHPAPPPCSVMSRNLVTPTPSSPSPRSCSSSSTPS